MIYKGENSKYPKGLKPLGIKTLRVYYPIQARSQNQIFIKKLKILLTSWNPCFN